MTIRCFVMRFPVVAAVLVAMTFLAMPPTVRATDPPPEDPPPPPQPGSLTLIREPAFNPAAPLLGRVQIIDPTGAVVLN